MITGTGDHLRPEWPITITGMRRYVRHPLYLAEELAVFGVFQQFMSVQSALILAVQIGFQLRRIHNEEIILTASFPEYRAYQASTARLVPGLIETRNPSTLESIKCS